MTKKITNTLVFIFTVLSFIACSKNDSSNPDSEATGKIRKIHYKGSYTRDFNDLNDLHLAAASAIGIKPLATRIPPEELKNKLVKIKAGNNCDIDELTHSIPYLVPQAAKLLYDISRNFADSLASHNAPKYKFIITSVTRTVEDVKRLGQTNINASMNSAHMYGTTFDISWRRFNKATDSAAELSEEQLKMLLASVLRDLQKAGRCYIKHEKKQACFHITAR